MRILELCLIRIVSKILVPYMSLFRIVICWIIVGIVGDVTGQDAHYCADAIPICDISQFENTNFTLINPRDYDRNILSEIPNCLNGTNAFQIQNPTWHHFIATESSASLDLILDNCVENPDTPNSGVGLQIAVIDDCTSLNQIYCQSDTIMDDIFITIDNLVKGQSYFLIVDGFAGSLCDYSFDNVSGFGYFDLEELIKIDIEGFPNDTICAGALDVNLSLGYDPGENLAFARSTHWQICDDAMSPTILLDTIIQGTSIEFDFLNAGKYIAKTRAFNACDTTNVLSTTIIVESLDTILIDTFTFCTLDLSKGNGLMPPDPDYFGPPINTAINNPFIYSTTTISGCPIVYVVPLNPIFNPDKGVDSVAFCGPGPITYQGQDFFTSVTDMDITLDGAGEFGCDSVVSLSLAILQLDGSLEVTSCNDNQSSIVFTPLIALPTDYDSITYNWHNRQGLSFTPVMGNPLELILVGADTVILESVIYKFGVGCPGFPIEVVVEPVNNQLNIRCTERTASSVKFAWDDLVGIDSYEVWINGTMVTTTSSLSYIATNLMDGEEVKIRVVADSPGNCTDFSDEFSCFAFNCPQVSIDLSIPDTEICITPMTQDIDIDATVIGAGPNAIFSWQSDGVIDQNGVFSPVQSGEGRFYVRYIYEENGCNTDNEIFITIAAMPTSSFNVQSEICVDDVAMIMFTGTASLSDNIDWDIEGIEEVSGSFPGPFQIKWSEAGSYDVTLTINNDVCTSQSVTQTVVVQDRLSAPDISCSVDFDKINFTWPSIDCASTYRVFIDNMDMGIQTDTNYLVQNIAEGTQVEIVVEAISECLCGNSISNLLSCQARSCPSIELNLQPIPDICLTEDVAIQQLGVQVMGGSGVGVGSWSGSGVIDDDKFDPKIVGTGIHMLTYTYLSDGCSFDGTMEINVLEVPEISFATADPVCMDEDLGTLNITVMGGSGNYKQFLDQVILPDLSTHNVSVGVHELLIEDLNSCMVSKSFEIQPAPVESMELKGPPTVIYNESMEVDLVSTVAIPDSVIWYLDGSAYCFGETCLTDFIPTSSGELCAELYYNGCMLSNCIAFRVEKALKYYVPNIISLSAIDGNGRFQIFTNDDNILVRSMSVYDRWGNRVYSGVSTDEALFWDGKFGSQELNPDVYVYMIEIIDAQGISKTITGDVTLIR